MSEAKQSTSLPMTAVALLATLISATGCIEYLGSGEFGELRYFGEVRGAVPLRLIPPVSDRAGNAYVLFGASDLNQVEAFIGHKNGGWSSGCDLHKGDARGAHGWVGRAFDRAWYWSGDALVEVSGRTGSCRTVLDRDPASNADLQFKGVIPHVRETPSRTSVVGLIQSPSDRVPFFVVVDLDIQRYTSVNVFEPTDASNVEVLGTGADPDSDTGFMVIRYERSAQIFVEGIFLDMDGNVIARAGISGAEALPVDAIAGYFHSLDGRLVAGFVRGADQLLVFDRSGGGLRPAGAFGGVGVHRWDDQLWVAGYSGTEPVVGKIDGGGNVGAALVWDSSQRFANGLAGAVLVLDDRSDPRRGVNWFDSRSAIGPAPFVSEHGLDTYAVDTTGWLVAGPSFDVGGEPQTSVAFAPVGVSYP